MNELQQLLNEKFKISDKEDLIKYFFDEFGVNVNFEAPNLYLFKYSQIDVKWSESVPHVCRGTIMRNTLTGWEYCSRPFEKFFNHFEHYCPLSDDKYFSEHYNNLSLVEKSDGTCIQVWYDSELNKWRISTLGSITTSRVGDFEFTFESLFLKLIPYENLEQLDKDYTYLFELCTYYNVIVTKYKTDRVYFLAKIKNVNGSVEENDVRVKNMTNVFYPYKKKLSSDIYPSNKSELLDYVEKNSNVVGEDVEFPEGFVIYKNRAPLGKMKNALYLQLHSVGGGDIKHSRNLIVESIFTNTIDDIYDKIRDDLKSFADNVKLKAKNLISDIHNSVSVMRAGKYENQKEYALKVMSTVQNKALTSFFFQNKEVILSENYDQEVAEKWLRENYKKFVDYFKE